MKREPLKASINVTRLLKEPVGSSQNHYIGGKLAEAVEGSIEGKIKVTRISRGVLVQCKLDAELKLICSRCLEAFLCPISLTAEEEFLAAGGVSNGSALTSPEQSERFTIDDRNILDLGELIRQYVLLNLPMKPLCRPDCPGTKEDKSDAATT